MITRRRLRRPKNKLPVLKVYLVLRYKQNECRVINTYLTQEGAEAKQKRLQQRQKPDDNTTFHVIEQSILG